MVHCQGCARNECPRSASVSSSPRERSLRLSASCAQRCVESLDLGRDGAATGTRVMSIGGFISRLFGDLSSCSTSSRAGQVKRAPPERHRPRRRVSCPCNRRLVYPGLIAPRSGISPLESRGSKRRRQETPGVVYRIDVCARSSSRSRVTRSFTLPVCSA